MQKIITYLAVSTFFISVLIGCANSSKDKVAETKPGSVIVDSSDYNEEEAKKLADTQCAKSNRRAKKISRSSNNSGRYHYYSCIF